MLIHRFRQRQGQAQATVRATVPQASDKKTSSKKTSSKKISSKKISSKKISSKKISSKKISSQEASNQEAIRIASAMAGSRALSGPFLVRSLVSRPRYRSRSPQGPLSQNMLGIVLATAAAGTLLGWVIFSNSFSNPNSTPDAAQVTVQESAPKSAQTPPKPAAPKPRIFSGLSFSGLFKGSSVQADPDDYFSEGILPDPVTDPANKTSKTSSNTSSNTSAKTSAPTHVRPHLKVPQQVAPGTVVWVGGDASLIRLSELLRYEFKRRFPGTEVDVRTANTETALANVLDGSLDVAAISRPLTPAEEAQGLIAVPLARHKIAVLIGPNNPFEGSLTNLQLAQILRGEITRWSQVGGQDSPLRLVDRAANSATREALIRYPMFAGVDKTTGAPPGRGDRLSDIAATLGVDGITYALIDQVSDDIVNPDQVSRGDVKIVPLHQVMPDDPRYSISQPMVYVYRGPKPSAKAEAFMAYATVLRGRGLLADGASLNARGTWLDNWAVRGLLLLAGGTILVSAIADLRKDNLQSTRLRATFRDNPGGKASAGGENPQSQALGNLEFGDLEFYDERTSTHLLLSLEDRDFQSRDFPAQNSTSSHVSSPLSEGRTLWARWMVADQQRASLPIEQGGGLEVRLYEYQAQEAIPTEAMGSAQLGSVARHRPFLAYPCDGPEGIIALHPRNCRPGTGYVAELGYLAADNRWTKVAISTVVRLPIQFQAMLR